jgi:pimeloyl-ACP methyl ester carboxylesterase
VFGWQNICAAVSLADPPASIQAARVSSRDVARLFGQQEYPGSRIGYVHQLLAGSVWTSLFALPTIRQRTLLIAGTDDPIIPVVNAHIMNRLLPRASLHLHNGGHIDLVTNATELAPVIDEFRRSRGRRP